MTQENTLNVKYSRRESRINLGEFAVIRDLHMGNRCAGEKSSCGPSENTQNPANFSNDNAATSVPVLVFGH